MDDCFNQEKFTPTISSYKTAVTFHNSVLCHTKIPNQGFHDSNVLKHSSLINCRLPQSNYQIGTLVCEVNENLKSLSVP